MVKKQKTQQPFQTVKTPDGIGYLEGWDDEGHYLIKFLPDEAEFDFDGPSFYKMISEKEVEILE